MNDIFKGTLRGKQFVIRQVVHHQRTNHNIIPPVLMLNIDKDKNKIDIVLQPSIIRGVSDSDFKKISRNC